MDDGVITTQHLQTFLRIVQLGSFSEAAMALDVAQPTISGRVKTLEQTLGGPLFVRHGRRISLTARGETFRSYAQQALAILEEGMLASRIGESRFYGRVHIGLTDSALTDSVFGLAVSRFAEDHPGVEVFVETNSCRNLVRSLHEGEFKLAMVPWPYASPAYDPLRPLLHFRERLVMVASAEHELAGMDELTLADVAACANPFFKPWWNQRTSREIDALPGIPSVLLEIPVAVARNTLLQGRGVAMFAPSVIAHELSSGDLVELDVVDLPAVESESALVRHAMTHDLSPAVLAFLEILRDEAGPLCVGSTLDAELEAVAP